MKICGIDSATHTGLVLLDTCTGETRCRAIEVNSRGFSRLQSIAAQVELSLSTCFPNFCVIEAYAFTRNVDSFIRLVEVGTVIKQVLFRRDIPWVEVSPTSLKKWTTGSGAADKDRMAVAVAERWGFKNPNTDLVDAYALARMGEMGMEELKAFLAPKKKVKRKKAKNGN